MYSQCSIPIIPCSFIKMLNSMSSPRIHSPNYQLLWQVLPLFFLILIKRWWSLMKWQSNYFTWKHTAKKGRTEMSIWTMTITDWEDVSVISAINVGQNDEIVLVCFRSIIITSGLCLVIEFADNIKIFFFGVRN